MAFVVEDGTGLSDATALLSVEDWQSHADARGRSYSGTYSTQDIEAAIVRASEYISESFDWQGYRLKERGHADGMQGLTWPRVDVEDDGGYSVPSDSIPPEIEKATAEVAWIELQTPGTMAATYTPHDRVRMEKVDGAVAVEYDVGNRSAEGARPVVLVVHDLVGQFMRRGGSSRLSGRAVRV